MTLIAALTGVAMANAANPKHEVLDTLRSYQLQDVQVVATRASKKTPMAFTNITQEQIKRLNTGRDIPFLLTTMPSVVTTSDAGNGMGYTGLRIRGTDASRINVTTNGIHGRPCIEPWKHSGATRCGHFYQWCGRIWRNGEHANREYWTATLGRIRPFGRLLLLA